MKSFVWCGLIPLIHATKYYVEVSHAKDLVDEDADVNLYFTTIKRTNDPYVEVLAFGDCGDSCIKSAKTDVEESTETPEWDQGFIFDEESDDCGRYEKLIFKLWDDDSLYDGMTWIDPDFLGETEEFDLDQVRECDEIYATELDVSRGGTLFIEVSKSCESASSSSEEDKKASEDDKSASEEDKKASVSVDSKEIEKELESLEEKEKELEDEKKELEEEKEEEEEKGGGGGGGGKKRLLMR